MDVSETFKTLGDETRLRILNLVCGRELCVCLIKEVLNLQQPNVSKHLGRLKAAGIISCRKISQWCFFRISDTFKAECGALCEFMRTIWSSEKIYLEDTRRLECLMETNDCCEELIRKASRAGVAVARRG